MILHSTFTLLITLMLFVFPHIPEFCREHFGYNTKKLDLIIIWSMAIGLSITILVLGNTIMPGIFNVSIPTGTINYY